MTIRNFNVTPYYDDYDDDKRFLRLLFRPGYAVQARELTQLQTILQNQVSRFGNHIFKHGSVVTGGQVNVSTKVRYHKLETTDTNGDDIDVNNFLGKAVGDSHALGHSGGLGRVVAVAAATDTEPPTIMVEYTTGVVLGDGQTIYTIEDSPYNARLIATGSSGLGSIAHIDEGIYYVDGFFVKVLPQTIILGKYTNDVTYRVGLIYDDEVVTEVTDTSLLDPALDASNYQAPGSARYKITLTLEKRTTDSTDDSKFIEIVRTDAGTVTKNVKYPIYSDLEATFARRTFDESGDYTVRPFALNLKDHIPAAGSSANASFITASLSPGKAYVRGYEFETIAPTNLEIEKARTTETVNNYDIATNYGNYFVAANVKGFFDIGSMVTTDMHCVQSGSIVTANSTTYNSTKIGTARVRQLQFVSAANTQLSSTYLYDTYVFDTRFTPITGNATGGTASTLILPGSGASPATDNAFANATIRITTGSAGDNVARKISGYVAATRTLTVANNFPTAPTSNSVYSIEFNIKDVDSITIASGSTIKANADVHTSNKQGGTVAGNTFFSDTNFNTLLFAVPQSYVSYGMSDQAYRTRKVYTNQTVSSGALALSTGSPTTLFVGSGALSDSQKTEHFIVVANNATGSEFTSGQVVPFTTASRTISVSGGTATLDFNSSNTFTVDVIASVDNNAPAAKTKQLNLANTTLAFSSGGTTIGSTTIYTSAGQVAISAPNRIPGKSDSLWISDIFKLEGVFEEQYGDFSITKSDGTVRKASFKVIDSGNIADAVTSADMADSSKDITDRYILDDGQRDNYYDHGAITLRPGSLPPAGQILVLVNYFTHVGSGYCSVDSYTHINLGADADIRYAKIPKYTSPTTGTIYNLRDCIDFRPIRANAVNVSPNFTLNGVAIPKADESLTSDYSYYVPRIDKIVLKAERQFQIIKGLPAVNAQTPVTPDNAMALYTIVLSPYTFFPNDTVVRYVENKRYTMKDIGRLEKRIDNLEYYTSLNSLEKTAADTTVLDENGLERFKNGILVDNFRGHGVGDVSNFEYRCSVDKLKGELRPPFVPTSHTFVVDANNTTANISAGSIVTTTYVSEAAIVQDISSNAIAVNPFTMTNYVGSIDLTPASDTWVDTKKNPDVLVNLQGNNDAWDAIGKALNDPRSNLPGWGEQWNSWEDVAGSKTVTNDRYSVETINGSEYRDPNNSNLVKKDVSERVTQQYTVQQTRTGTQQIMVPETITKSIGNRQVDLSVIPYIRAQKVIAVAKNLRSNERIHVFFDDIKINDFIERPACMYLYNATGNFHDKFGEYETVTSSSGGRGTVIFQGGRSWSLNQPRIYLVDVSGTFAANDTVTGATSGATAKIDIPVICTGGVTTAGSTSITLANGMPYDNWYSSFSTVFPTINWPFTGLKVMDQADQDEVRGYKYIKIIAGKGLGQTRTITAYNGTTKVATISSAWTVIPDSTSIYTVGNLYTNDFGVAPARVHFPSYEQSGLRFRTGSRLIRICNDTNNNVDNITSFADAYFHANGLLNTVEEVSVSVRVPTLQTKQLSASQTSAARYAVLDPVVTNRGVLVRDETPAPGGSDCKIICAKLNKLGYFENDINTADQRFGVMLKRRYPMTYKGYVYWAQTVVDWMEGKGPNLGFFWPDQTNRAEIQKNFVIKYANKMARPWAEEMACMMKVREESNLAGKIMMGIGLPICALIGWINPRLDKEDTLLKGYTIFFTLSFFYFVTMALTAVTTPVEKIKNFIKSKIVNKFIGNTNG